ncbi:MAG: hypothetical protein J7K22_00640 [Nanoarchaeota archaeon]|nr:hypothetical protein [Nanoarchaeota archaeon]
MVFKSKQEKMKVMDENWGKIKRVEEFLKKNKGRYFSIDEICENIGLEKTNELEDALLHYSHVSHLGLKTTHRIYRKYANCVVPVYDGFDLHLMYSERLAEKLFDKSTYKKKNFNV